MQARKRNPEQKQNHPLVENPEPRNRASTNSTHSSGPRELAINLEDLRRKQTALETLYSAMTPEGGKACLLCSVIRDGVNRTMKHKMGALKESQTGEEVPYEDLVQECLYSDEVYVTVTRRLIMFIATYLEGDLTPADKHAVLLWILDYSKTPVTPKMARPRFEEAPAVT